MKNYTYSGWKLNGFVALLLNVALCAAAIYLLVNMANDYDFQVWKLVCVGLLALFAFIMVFGYVMLEPNESRVLLFFGNYRGTFYNTGF